jgi:benzoyl-CoA 2,3-dioxygenase component B
VPMRNALNEVLREEYIADNQRAVDRWNKALEEAGVSERLKLPHRRFNRQIGEYAGHRFDPEGNLVSDETWNRMKDTWLVTDADRAYVQSIQVQVTEPGKMANWIAPPRVGIKGRPVEFEYVRL